MQQKLVCFIVMMVTSVTFLQGKDKLVMDFS